jgi:hypothetical protein
VRKRKLLMRLVGSRLRGRRKACMIDMNGMAACTKEHSSLEGSIRHLGGQFYALSVSRYPLVYLPTCVTRPAHLSFFTMRSSSREFFPQHGCLYFTPEAHTLLRPTRTYRRTYQKSSAYMLRWGRHSAETGIKKSAEQHVAVDFNTMCV